MKFKTCLINSLAAFSRPGWRASLVHAFCLAVLRIVRPRINVARENLGSVFPDATDSWIRDTVNGVYSHLSWMVAEYLALQRDPRLALNWMRAVEGKEILDELKASGSGAIILTGHLGNWELLAAWLAQSGYPLSAVVRNPDDSEVAALIASYRTKAGVGFFEKQHVMKEAVRFARKGGFLGLLIDQAWNISGVPTTFLGRPCYTASGPAAIAKLAGVPVVPVASYRVAPFKHQVFISDPITMNEDTAGKEEYIKKNTEIMNKTVEKMILNRP
ncbi:MAG: lysophospholipid acyltransferase family protein, partial [Synergistota bacterium]|nr:lysophospholipid acyltransferase family protein [Synergistota bacterium]